MTPEHNRIESKIAQGYKLNFETVFNQIFENYKKIAVYAGLILFVFGILLIAIVYGGLLAYFGLETITEMIKPENLKPENFSREFIINYTICAVLFTCFISPFTAGLIKMAYCADRDEEFHLSTIFAYYKFPQFMTLFVATLIITVINTGISTSTELMGIPLIGSIITMLISFYTLLTIPLIIFGNLGALQSIKSSITLISKQPLIIVSLCAVSILATLVGLVVFIIGIIFTIPFIYSFYYILYKEIIGFEE